MTFDAGRIRHAMDLMHYSKASNGTSIPSNWIPAATGDSGVGWQPAPGGGSVSYGSNSSYVAEISLVGVRTDVARSDHYHGGVNNITSSSSNTLQRGTVNFRSGANIGLSASDTDGDGEFDTITITSSAAGGGGGGGGLAKSYLGYNTVGASWETWTLRRQFCKAFTPAANGTAISVEAYLRPSTDNVNSLLFAIMADNAGAPGTLLGGASMTNSTVYLSNSASMPGAGRWFSAAMSVDLTSGTQYWASIMEDGTLFDIAYDGSGSDQYFNPTVAVVTGAYPSVWTITTGSRKYSIRIGFLS